MAHWTECHVDALELQQDLHDMASSLTDRCDMDEKVTHICGDILSYPLRDASYNVLVSWLVFLHIPDKLQLFTACYKALKPGGKMYVEDYYQKETFTKEEQESLANDVFVNTLCTWNELTNTLNESGFTIVEIKDTTEVWRTYVNDRYLTYVKDMERHVRVHGTSAADSLHHFYRAVHTYVTSFFVD